jgi:hypothetical protein
MNKQQPVATTRLSSPRPTLCAIEYLRRLEQERFTNPDFAKR